MRPLQRYFTTVALLLLAVSLRAAEKPVAPQVPIPSAAEILSKLRPGHPRLLSSADDFAKLQSRVKFDDNLKKWHADLHQKGEEMLQQAPSKYEIPDGLRLLATSRRVLIRIQTLALLYRLDGDRRFADRAWLELETAANFKDWNNRHFLDTAEMTHAFAIGYDWLYDVWTPAQREILRTAMVEKGIKAAMKIHEEHRWWATVHHNWNQVCNGGIGMGALALAEVEPELAGRFLHAAMESIQLAMVEYGPDGAWAEGPGYWNYATTYNVVFLAGLESALGTDFGLSQIPGFSEAGTFPIYATGPTGASFSYADAHAGSIHSPALFWLARKFNRPEFAWHQVQNLRAEPLDILWYDASLARPTKSAPLDKYYRNSEIATLRGGWDDPKATFVGLKAGDNRANHSHLDLGSFILDAQGVRWAEDIGADDYNLPAYFGGKRWTYYRLRAEGHNTLVIDPSEQPDQDPKAVARIIRFESKPDHAFVITDLSSAYAKQAAKLTRGIALLDRRQVLVQDELNSAQTADLWWFMHTKAKIEISENGTTAMLTLNQQRLEARLCSPPTAVFTAMEAAPLPSSPHPAGQAENKGVSKLAVHLKDARDLRLAVLFTPLRDGEKPGGPAPSVSPLSEWK